MKLLLHWEEWKKQQADEQGVEGKTYKLTRETPFKETRYEKIPALAYNFESLLSELNAREMVEMVNKAFKAYGYKTDMLSVPALFKYDITYDESQPSVLLVKIVTSSFNKVNKNHDEQKQKLWNIVGEKALMLNFLIQNNDMHMSNFVKKQGALKNYAIDFGMAFTNSGRGDVDVTIETLKNARERLIEEHPEKMERYANYLNFWQMFLDNNFNNLLAVFDRNKEVIEKQIKAVKAPEQVKTETLDGVRQYSNKIKSYFRSHMELLKKFVDETIPMVDKAHNKFQKGE